MSTSLIGFMGLQWRRMARECAGCAYQWQRRTCDYITIVGHQRPCPSGKACTERKSRPQQRKQWAADWTMGRALYQQGKTDLEIAEALGCERSSVYHWRWRNGLEGNGGRPVPPQTAKGAETCREEVVG